jgi:methyl-accepting chemotaxis protein
MRFTIPARVAAAFAAILAIMAVIGLNAISRTSSMAKATNVVASDVVPATRIIGDLKDDTGRYRRNQILFVLRQSDRAEIAESVTDVKDELADYRAHYVSGAGDRKAMAGFEAAWTTYRDATAGVFDLPANDIEGVTTLISSGDGDAAWEAVKASLKAWDAANATTAAGLVAETRTAAAHTRAYSLVLLLGGILIAAGLACLLISSLSRGLGRLVAAARGIAHGDVEQDVQLTSNDELGDAGRAFTEMVDYLKASVASADRIADGDLSHDIAPHSERDALGNALQNMTVRLRTAIGDVAGSATSVAAASQQMASSADETGRAVGEIALAISEIAEGAESQVRSVAHARGAVEEVSMGVQDSARTAGETRQAADDARTVARDGVAAAEQVTEAMSALRDSSAEVAGAIESLGTKSDAIGGIVAAITAIAEQTNLLALNAAIEAARAGEQGRGFAVVAEEVRKLAEESQGAAGQISGLVDEMQRETRNVVDVVKRTAERTDAGAVTVEQARAAFERIGETVDDMGGRVGHIAELVDAIAAGAGSMQSEIGAVSELAERSSAATEQVSASAQQTSASAQEIAASAESLSSTAEALERIFSRFRLTAA